jgi:hypothetical protein
VSVTELYDAFASGKITRGAFIRRLVAFGMSASVAAAYANTLARPALAGGTSGAGFADYYDYYDYYDFYPGV